MAPAGFVTPGPNTYQEATEGCEDETAEGQTGKAQAVPRDRPHVSRSGDRQRLSGPQTVLPKFLADSAQRGGPFSITCMWVATLLPLIWGHRNTATKGVSC